MDDRNSRSLALARSLLFVPGHTPRRFGRGLESEADAVILDLEDAVAPRDKAAARANVVAWLSKLHPEDRARTLVRINASDTPTDHLADLHALQTLGHAAPAAIVVPKAASIDVMAGLAERLPNVWLVPLIESAQGWASVDALACARGVLRLAFGHLDFQLDLDMSCGSEQVELLPVRLDITAASRRAGLAAPVDSVTPDVLDDVLIDADTIRSRKLGFGGRLCIHPRQAPIIHAALSPTEAEVTWARQVVQANKEKAGEVFQFDGRMVDMPVLLKAERILRNAG